MIQKISFMGGEPNPLKNQKQDININEVKEEKTNSVKDGDKKSLAILAAAGVTAAALITGGVIFYKTRPEVIMKNLTKTGEKEKNSALQLVKETLSSFTTKNPDGSEKTIMQTFNELCEKFENGDSLPQGSQSLGNGKAFRIKPFEEADDFCIELLDNDKVVGNLSLFEDDYDGTQIQYTMEKAYKKGKDKLEAYFPLQNDHSISFSDIAKMGIEKNLTDKSSDACYMYIKGKEDNVELIPHGFVKNLKYNDDGTISSKLYAAFYNGKPYALQKDVPDCTEEVCRTAYYFDDNGKRIKMQKTK